MSSPCHCAPSAVPWQTQHSCYGSAWGNVIRLRYVTIEMLALTPQQIFAPSDSHLSSGDVENVTVSWAMRICCVTCKCQGALRQWILYVQHVFPQCYTKVVRLTKPMNKVRMKGWKVTGRRQWHPDTAWFCFLPAVRLVLLQCNSCFARQESSCRSISQTCTTVMSPRPWRRWCPRWRMCVRKNTQVTTSQTSKLQPTAVWL